MSNVNPAIAEAVSDAGGTIVQTSEGVQQVVFDPSAISAAAVTSAATAAAGGESGQEVVDGNNMLQQILDMATHSSVVPAPSQQTDGGDKVR